MAVRLFTAITLGVPRVAKALGMFGEADGGPDFNQYIVANDSTNLSSHRLASSSPGW